MARGTLAEELAKPSFTPGRADAPALVELVVSGDERAAPALAKLANARDVLAARLATEADEAGGARLLGALGLLARAGDLEARTLVLAKLSDGSSRVRRAAIVAAGKLGTNDVIAADALVIRWDASDVTPEERRALAEALGKLGGAPAVDRLKALDAGDDAELARRRDRALLMMARDAKRPDGSVIATEVAPLAPLTVRLHCRAGLSDLLLEDLRAKGITARSVDDAMVEVTLSGPWSTLFVSRLWTHGGIRVRLAAETPEAITDAIVAAEPMMAAWTVGPVRWRLGFQAGHRRAVVWRVARDVTARAPRLINDPTQTAWDILVDGDHLELVPRRAEDTRFAYRVADVPAASHPTIAAALAWLAQPTPRDRIWDPFCGSGVELIECARLGGAAVEGSDLDETALAAARENFTAAQLTAPLVRADARTHAPRGITVIVTNPPLGSRVQVDAIALLISCLPHFAAQLPRGGRLIWITPNAKRTGPFAEEAGFVRELRYAVDLGGVRGTLERWIKK